MILGSISGFSRDKESKSPQFHGEESNERKALLEECTTDDKAALERKLKVKGLNTCTAGVFLLSVMVGAGALAFPKALSKSGGFIGILSLVVIILMAFFCGHLLGQCWLKYNDNRKGGKPIRDPYPAVAEFAGGVYLRHTVTFALTVSNLFMCIAFLILISEMLQLLIPFHLKGINRMNEVRVWLVIVSICLFPPLLYGTPKDFKFIGYFAAIFSLLFIGLIWLKYILVLIDDETVSSKEKKGGERMTIKSFLSAFGAFIFGTSSVFYVPTLQTDMKAPDKVTRAIFLAFSFGFLIYLATSVGGYLTVNSLMNSTDNIIDALVYYDDLHGKNDILMVICKVAAMLHIVCAFVLLSNPCSQQLEEALGVPNDFSWKRVLSRGFVLLVALAAAEIYPSFATIISLIGGSLMTLTCYLIPVTIYVKLFPERSRILNVILYLVGVTSGVMGVASTVACFIEIAESFKNLYSS